ncbi:E3 ubiquitin-protein ligase TRIM21-like isoform X1 [Lates japonicus]|uniref:E3 ubiquitin-protein ligase TRIM21-like isoform X1 n=1 Tax=Lates japonicus TaxID=270547 RepID=A0AAD3QW95_LATJO|nr:E3 ubiquitin-protein ligase TRIM21-like isoform X1 [Lates japonicus]
MAKLEEKLWNILQELGQEEFKRFKWFLKKDGILEDFPGIPWAQLENAERQDTVDLMVQKYQDSGAQKVTLKVLEKLNRNDLVQHLQNSSLRPKDLKTLNVSAWTEGYSKKKAELKWVQQFAVEVTLDRNTAHPNLLLSDDGKQVHHGDVRRNLPDNPQRFYSCVNVLGKQSFSSGKFYYEVQVKGKTAWTLGVASESVDRKGQITLSPKNGFWTLWLRNGDEYVANDKRPVHLSLENHPQMVGLFLDYEEGLVSFYDVNAADLLYSFTDCSFTEKIYPYFSPCTNDNGRNSAPLIISPVKHQLNLETQDLSDQEEDYE